MCSATTVVHIHNLRCRTAFLGEMNNRMMNLHHHQSSLLLNVVANAAAVVVHRILRRCQNDEDSLFTDGHFESADEGQFWTSTESSVTHNFGGHTE
jgi:hypothetical protein